ncbi:hypothetical protein [Methylobacterium iners]|uniref:hypothetical protein n=1 Tax=Methylobacterium iners TaxID=418707 RepID=UPI001EE2A3A5|nr:hypothetical protein [Methylobacterium iners]
MRTTLAQVLGVKLSPDLRLQIAAAAQREGISDSAWLRQRALDALGTVSAPDAASGRRPRVAPEDQAALAGAVRDLGEATVALAAVPSRHADATAALQRARETIVPIVIGFERRPS